MSYTYEITLKPLEPFFFGGEFTFGADESRGEVSRYSATSIEFPQQTAVLGMLRKTMLILNGNLTMHKKGEWIDSRGKGHGYDENYEKGKELVGIESFSYEHTVDLGTIESLSPIFIKRGDESFVANAKDDGLRLRSIPGNISFGNKEQEGFVLEGYDAKSFSPKAFVSATGEKRDYDDFFETVAQVGIKKAKDGDTNEKGFFRKKSYYPKDNAYFSFVLTLGRPWEWERDTIVSLGADQSSFKLEVRESAESFETIFGNPHQTQGTARIVLASEALLSQEAYKKCFFIVGERRSFRQLVDARSGKKSKRYYLLERGSVLYTDNIDALDELLAQEHLQAIGINKFFKIKGEN